MRNPRHLASWLGANESVPRPFSGPDGGSAADTASVPFPLTLGPAALIPSTSTCGELAPTEPLAGLICEVADVLYDATLWRRWLWRLLPRLGVSADYHEFFAAWDREFLVDVQRGRREMGEAFQAFLAGHGLSWGQIDEVQAACHKRRETITSETRPLPGVVETLAALAAEGLQLAALADSPHPAAQIEKQFSAMGLGGRFATIVSSFDLEATTPAPDGYLAALAGLGLRAPQVAYVGRRARSVAGATQLGLRTIAFNQEERAQANVAIRRFADLLDVARRWRTGANVEIARQTFFHAA